jgi:hypothetical protein
MNGQWMPIWDRVSGRFAAMREELDRLADSAGVPPAPVTVYWAPQVRGELERLRESGVHRVLLRLPTGSRGEQLDALDSVAPLVAELA